MSNLTNKIIRLANQFKKENKKTLKSFKNLDTEQIQNWANLKAKTEDWFYTTLDTQDLEGLRNSSFMNEKRLKAIVQAVGAKANGQEGSYFISDIDIKPESEAWHFSVLYNKSKITLNYDKVEEELTIEVHSKDFEDLEEILEYVREDKKLRTDVEHEQNGLEIKIKDPIDGYGFKNGVNRLLMAIVEALKVNADEDKVNDFNAFKSLKNNQEIESSISNGHMKKIDRPSKARLFESIDQSEIMNGKKFNDIANIFKGKGYYINKDKSYQDSFAFDNNDKGVMVSIYNNGGNIYMDLENENEEQFWEAIKEEFGEDNNLISENLVDELSKDEKSKIKNFLGIAETIYGEEV